MSEFQSYDRIDEVDPVVCLSCGQEMDWEGPPVSEFACCRSCWERIGVDMRFLIQFLALPIEQGGIGCRELLLAAKSEFYTTRSILDPGPN